jgi:hypothetical protein
MHSHGDQPAHVSRWRRRLTRSVCRRSRTLERVVDRSTSGGENQRPFGRMSSGMCAVAASGGDTGKRPPTGLRDRHPRAIFL